MFNRKSIIILFINRNRFQLYGDNLPGVVTTDVPETHINDLEVVSKDGLYTLVKQWIKQYALSGVQVVVIFSDTSYFEKTFALTDPAQLETEVIRFFDAVPFESVISRVYDVQNGKHAIAVNKTLYETIFQGFSLQGLAIKGVLPIFVLGPLAGKKNLDGELAEYVFKNLDTLLRQSLVDAQELSSGSTHGLGGRGVSSGKTSRLPLLLGIFGILVVVLIVVVIQFT